MENVTKPEQIVFLAVLFCVFCIVAWRWLYSGKSKQKTPVSFDPVEIIHDTWAALLHWRPVPMSSESEEEARKKTDVPPVVTTFTAAEQSIVTPNNEYSGGLSDSGRVQFEDRARTLATLYEAGIVTNLSKAICKAYGCTVQSATKTDSTYQMALKAVNKYLPKKNTDPQYRERTPEQEALRDQLRLH